MAKAWTRFALSAILVSAMMISGLSVGFLRVSQDNTEPVDGYPEIVEADRGGFAAIDSEGGAESVSPDTGQLAVSEIVESAEKFSPAPSPAPSDLGVDTQTDTMSPTINKGIGVSPANVKIGLNSPYFYLVVSYNPPDCPEGNCIVHLEVMTDITSLIFCRWDFNGDKIVDTPWMTEKSYDIHNPPDNLDSEVCVECWDGVSTKTVTLNGTLLGYPTDVDLELNMLNVGMRFKPKEAIKLTAIGYWKNATNFQDLSMTLWDYSSQAALGLCRPPKGSNNSWNWCRMPGPIALVAGESYMISCHKSSPNPPWSAIYNKGILWDKVLYQGYYYSSSGMPLTYGGTNIIPKCDIEWEQTVVVPATRIACANCTVNNVPPTVTDADCSLELFPGDAWLRIAGEKWHDVQATLYRNGSEISNATIVRYPGSPDDQRAMLGRVEPGGQYSITALYTPNDDAVNGEELGATPAWVILELDDGSVNSVHHTFNVAHPDTWVWTEDGLEGLLMGRTVTCTATATDPGMDDLTFEWDFGDGSPVVTSVYLNDGIFPFTATDVQTHTYAMAGVYDVKVRVSDDDGGVTELLIAIAII